MTLRPLLAAIALVVASAPGVVSAQPTSEATTNSSSSSTVARTTQATRKAERTRPGTPLKPRVIEAPGAAVLMIPASYEPSQHGLFAPF